MDLRFFPADSFCPGQTPAQEARFPGVGNLVMSAPVSAMTTSESGRAHQPGVSTPADEAEHPCAYCRRDRVGQINHNVPVVRRPS